jgi:hypothetical protein
MAELGLRDPQKILPARWRESDHREMQRGEAIFSDGRRGVMMAAMLMASGGMAAMLHNRGRSMFWRRASSYPRITARRMGANRLFSRCASATVGYYLPDQALRRRSLWSAPKATRRLAA